MPEDARRTSRSASKVGTAFLLAVATLSTACGDPANDPSATALVELVPGSDAGSNAEALATQAQKLTIRNRLEAVIREADLVSRDDFAGMTVEEVVNALDGRVHVEPRRGGYLVDLRVQGANAAILDDVANALADSLVTAVQAEATARLATEKEQHERVIRGASHRIKAAMTDLRAFTAAENIEANAVDDEYERAKDARNQLTLAHDREYASLIQDAPTYKEFNAVLVDSETSLTAIRAHPVLLADTHYVTLLREIRTGLRNLELATLDERKGQDHPAVIAQRTSVARREAELDKYIRSLLRRFVSEYESREAGLERYDDEIRRATDTLRRIERVRERVQTHNAEIERHRATIRRTLADLDELRVIGTSRVGTVKILERAQSADG